MFELHGWIQSSSSDFQKSLKFFQTCVYFSVRFFLIAQEIKYPSYCSAYYEIKQRKKASNIVIPNEFDESLFARYRPLSRLPMYNPGSTPELFSSDLKAILGGIFLYLNLRNFNFKSQQNQ